MKILTEHEIMANYDRYLSLIEKHTHGDRKEKLLKLVEHFKDRILLDPASSKEHYHNAYPGGYLEHALHVYDIAMELYKVWNMFTDFVDYDVDTIAFIALHHDLGKLGDYDEQFYEPQTNDWRREHMGEVYTINPKCINMNGADKSIYTIQSFGIVLTQDEWITIKIHEGMYDEENGKYLKTSKADDYLRTSLPYLIHHADMMATRIEREYFINVYKEDSPSTKHLSKPKYHRKATLTETIVTDADRSDKIKNAISNGLDGIDDIFDDLFDKPKK